MRPLCSTANFVSGKCCFVIDLRTVTVDNVLDLPFIITELYWVTDIHWHGFSPETEHESSCPLSRVWTERNKKCSLTTDGGMKSTKFLVLFEALVLHLNVVSILQQMSAGCCYWFHTISSLWPSESLELGPLWWLLMVIVLSQLWLITGLKNTETHTCFMCQTAVPSINPQQELKDEWFAGSAVTLTLKYLYLQLCCDERLQISVFLSRRAGIFKWPSAGRTSQI